MRNKKAKRVMFLLVILLFITIGYALLSQRLDINGISKIDKATWKIHWDNVQVTEGSITGDQVSQAATITNEEQTVVEYSINLKKPKEFYEFTVDAVNEGTIDGMIDVVTNKTYESDGVTEKELPNYLTYTVTYGDGGEIDDKHLLKAGETETYKVMVKFKNVDDASQLPQNEETLKFKFSVDYIQADETGEVREPYTPFETGFSLEGLSVMSYDIDYDICMNEFSNQLPEEISAEAYCRGENVEYQGQTINIKQEIASNFSYYEEMGLIKNQKYGTLESYEINYEGCKNYLTSNGETDEEQVELFCTGNTATIFGQELNLNEMLEANPDSANAYEAIGLVSAVYTESKPNMIITSYEGEVPEDLVIPTEINDMEVVGVGESAFENRGIETVTIPNTVKFVEQDAFYGNKLKRVNIENSNLDIRDCAFGDKDNIDNHNLPEEYECKKIYWALQDNNNDDVNEKLVLSSEKVLGNIQGRFNEEEAFSSYNYVPWIAGDAYHSGNRSYNVTTVSIEDKIKPTSTANWFHGVGFNAETFSANLKNLDTSIVTDMSGMFSDAGQKATTWDIGDLSNWNTSQVTDMYMMFSEAGLNATSWTIGDLSNWNTSKVTNMGLMFDRAGLNATTWDIGDLNNWDTSQVTNMGWMFSDAGYSSPTWTIGDLSNWDTSKVTKMDGMFSGTSLSADTFDISYVENWNTSNVTSMRAMFSSAGENATTWDIGNLSNWNISKVTDIGSMFQSAGKNATTWDIGDLSNWDTSNVTDMSYMFYSAGQKATIFDINFVENWNISKVTNMSYMFYYAGENASTFNLNLNSWDTAQVKNMSCMFKFAGSNSETFNLNLSNWNILKTSDVTHMFYSAGENASTFSLNLSGWVTSGVEKNSDMFKSTGKNATTFSITIPRTNGNGIDNTTSKMYGENQYVYASPPSGRSFTLAAN